MRSTPFAGRRLAPALVAVAAASLVIAVSGRAESGHRLPPRPPR
jgi:hypothetical protein